MNYVTYSQLLNDFRALGVQAGDTIMLHASVKAMGWVVGGPDMVLRALQEVLTPDGTLMMFIGWEDDPYEVQFEGDEEALQVYLDNLPAFDPATARADRTNLSILTEYLRTTPGAVRSSEPYGFAAVGKHADYIVSEHPHNYRNGPGSPLEKLYQLGGKVLNIGAPLNTVTLLHYAEDICNVPNKAVVRYKMPLLQNGERVWVEYEEHDSSKGIAEWDSDYFDTIVVEFIEDRNLPTKYVGAAKSYLFDAQDLVAFGVQWMETEFRPVPTEGEP